MPRATAAHRLLPLLAGLLGLAALLSACGGSTDESQTNTGSTVATLPTSTTAIVPGGLQAACTAETLLPIVQAKYAGSTLADQVCLVPNAITTAKAPGAELVVFLSQVDGAWQIVADGPVGDAAGIMPKTFSTTLFNTWLDKRAPVAPTTTRPPGPRAQVTSSVPFGHAENCTGEGASRVCPTTTAPTIPPTIATTTAPPTTPPPPVTTAPPVTWVSP